jgi:hypothetical protein
VRISKETAAPLASPVKYGSKEKRIAREEIPVGIISKRLRGAVNQSVAKDAGKWRLVPFIRFAGFSTPARGSLFGPGRDAWDGIKNKDRSSRTVAGVVTVLVRASD